MYTVAKGPRIILRRLRLADAARVSELFDRDPEVTRFIGGTKSYEETRSGLERIVTGYQEPVHGVLAAETLEPSELIGWGMLKPFLVDPAETEIGYGVARAWWGQGYGTEIARVLLAYSFVILELDRIVAAVHPKNVRSRRILERLGMAFRGKVEWPDQGLVDSFALERADYLAARGAMD